MVLVGPSGCGKTTALRMLAGLEEITEGELVIDNTVVNEVAPQKRDIAMVFQNYALYPHLSVYDNMAYGLKIQKLGKAEIKPRVVEIAKVIGLEDLLDRKPKALSGGQRQRVAMGRAIVRRPKVFLMDEPLSNLDAKLRVQMRSEVARIQHELKATTVYVTHDQVEAMTMGDRVALMRRGVLQQVDTPMRAVQRAREPVRGELHRQPVDEPLRGPAGAQNGHLVARIGDQFLRLEPEAWPSPATGPLRRQDRRARHPARAPRGRGGRDRRADRAPAAGDRQDVEALGAELIAHLEIAGRPVMTDEVKEVAADLDDAMLTELEAEARRRQAAARRPLRRRLPRPRRRAIEVVVDTSHVHYFDLDTGAAIGGDARGGLTWPPPPSAAPVTARPKTKRRTVALQRRDADRVRVPVAGD